MEKQKYLLVDSANFPHRPYLIAQTILALVLLAIGLGSFKGKKEKKEEFNSVKSR